MRTQLFPRIMASLVGGLVLAAPLTAQNRLYVQEADDKYHAVFKVDGVRPYIMEKGVLVAAKGQRFALKKVEEYLPILIAVRDVDTRPTNVSVDYSDTPANNAVHFSAKFESVDPLEDVYVVLELDIPNVGKKPYVYEIGRLRARTPKAFSAELALGQYMGASRVDIHLFVGATEVFQSGQTAAYREEMLDRMIAKRIAAVQQAGPRPFYGAAPAYPPALRNTGLKGKAVVTMRISPQGTVIDPVVEHASEPAFGEEALAAVRQWRFVPQVKDGQAVETKVSMPFDFDPPPEKG